MFDSMTSTTFNIFSKNLRVNKFQSPVLSTNQISLILDMSFVKKKRNIEAQNGEINTKRNMTQKVTNINYQGMQSLIYTK